MKKGINMDISLENRKILELLAREFPNRRAAFAEIINLQAILNLPKGTEHFLSDLHGEYEAFKHILNNCSGVIREKVEFLFGDRLTPAEQAELCTLIYYPEEELERMKQGGEIPRLLYKQMLERRDPAPSLQADAGAADRADGLLLVKIYPLQSPPRDAAGIRLHHRRAAARPEG